MHPQLWVEPNGDLILARLRGVPTPELLRDCQEQVLRLLQEAGHQRVLYDVLEMEAPTPEVTFTQLALDAELQGLRPKRAIVVPNSRLAYLARIAFGEGDYRVFYNDLGAAIDWLRADADAGRLRVAR